MKKYNKAMHKIDKDYTEFKQTMINMDSESVYDFAYKIYCVEEIYQYLNNGYKFTREMLRGILGCQENVILHIYEKWSEEETGYYQDFCLFVDSSLKNLNSLCVAQKCA